VFFSNFGGSVRTVVGNYIYVKKIAGVILPKEAVNYMADYRFFIMGGNDQSKLFLGNIFFRAGFPALYPAKD